MENFNEKKVNDIARLIKEYEKIEFDKNLPMTTKINIFHEIIYFLSNLTQKEIELLEKIIPGIDHYQPVMSTPKTTNVKSINTSSSSSEESQMC